MIYAIFVKKSHKIVKKSHRRRFLSKVLLKLSKGHIVIHFCQEGAKSCQYSAICNMLLHISKNRCTFASDMNLTVNAAAGAAQSVGARNVMKKSANIAKMTAAEVMTAAASILKRYGSVSAVKAAAPGLREKYGAENWAAILWDIKAARAKDIKAAGGEVRGRVFTYSGILGAVFAEAAKGKAWSRLCKYARRKYTGRDADTAAQVVRDYYTNVDAAGAPVSRVRYITKSGGIILDTWEARPLTKSAAVSILEISLKGMEAAAVKAAQKGKDADTAVRDNIRDCGRVAAVYAVEADPVTGEFSAGSRLDKDTKERKADAAAARLVGRPVPTDASTLAEINAAIRAALADAAKAPKATATEKHTAKAPKGGKGKGKAPKAAPAVTSADAAAAAVAAA